MKYYHFLSFLALTLIILSCEDNFNFENQNQLQEELIHLRTCGSQEHQGKLLENPEYRQKYESRVLKLESKTILRSPDCSQPIILPVAIHFQSVSNPNKNCLIELAQRQVAILNADFQSTNADLTKWQQVKSIFPGINPSSACLEFCLASNNHPSSSTLTEGQPAVTFNETSGDYDDNWAGYLNIYVQFNSGYLGYAPLGGFGDGDGVVVDASAFGAGGGCGSISPESPYNLGRTLTHEVGHYLLLDHLWGEGGCNSDDNVSDTPPQSEPNYGCSAAGVQSCGTVDLHMNYMDYADDACMYMFSEGQATRMYNYVNVNLRNLIEKGAQVCAGPSNEEDADNDGVPDVDDNCPAVYNPNQADANQNGIGDVCEDKNEVDSDNDGISDDEDNCPSTFNPNQSDLNNNGIGDACEIDDPDLCKGLDFKIEITTDDYPEEIEWQIIDAASGSLIYEGSGYEYDPAVNLITEEMCIPEGCYEIVFTDAYGDGICCDYGMGNFSLSANGDVFYESDGNYGEEEVIYLCIQSQGLQKVEGRKAAKLKNLVKKQLRS